MYWLPDELPPSTSCWWDATCAIDIAVFAVEPPTFPDAATVFAPPVEAKALVPDLLNTALSCKSGTLKVDDPSPAP